MRWWPTRGTRVPPPPSDDEGDAPLNRAIIVYAKVEEWLREGNTLLVRRPGGQAFRVTLTVDGEEVAR